MKNNVVIAIFEVESEAFQAFNELRGKIKGAGYIAPEASLIRNKGGNIDMLDAYTVDTSAGEGTAAGMVIGALVGVLGGPIGVLLGAGVGAYAGSASDADRAVDAVNAVAAVASKIYDGETAVVALVQEDEPAFDTVFEAYKTTIIRYDAADIAKDAEELRQLEEQVGEEVMEQVKAEREAEREAKRKEHEEKIQAQMDEYVAATNRTMSDAAPM